MLRWMIVLVLFLSACGDDGDGMPPPPTDAGGVDSATGDDGGPGVDSDVPPTDSGSGSGWQTETPLPVNLQEISAAVIDDRIYVAGGFEGLSVTTTVRIFDPATDEWSTAPSLPFPRHHLQLVALGADLYAVGGMAPGGFSTVDTVFHLPADATDWAEVQAMPEPRGAGFGAAIDGRIYIAAGQNRTGLADDTLVYDPASNTWDRVAAIPTGREHVGGFVHDGEIWVVGGRNLSLDSTMDAVEIYDPVADEWRSGPSLQMARGGHGAAILDGVAYAAGGEMTARALNEVEALDIAGGATAWTPIAPLPTPRHGHAQAAAAGRIWVIGGGDMPVFAATNVVESFAP